MTLPLQKLVLKSTSKMSLNDRFTQLAFSSAGWSEDQDTRVEPRIEPRVTRAQTWNEDFNPRGQQRQHTWNTGIQDRGARGTTLPADTRRRQEPSPRPVMRKDPAASMPPYTPFKHMEEPSSMGLALRRIHEKSTTISATRLKNKSNIRQRLGVRARLTLPVYRPRYQYQSGAGRGYFNNSPSVYRWNRWGSTDTLHELRQAPRWPVRRNRGRFMGHMGQGMGRRWIGRRVAWRTANRRGRGAGQRGAIKRPPPPTKEQLDKEIDSYMAGTRSVLDQQLDDYRQQGSEAS